MRVGVWEGLSQSTTAGHVKGGDKGGEGGLHHPDIVTSIWLYNLAVHQYLAALIHSHQQLWLHLLIWNQTCCVDSTQQCVDLTQQCVTAASQEESVSTWHFMMGWMTVFTTHQVASWQLEVATGKKCIVCRTVEDMERHPHCWQQQHKAKQHLKGQRHGVAARLTGRVSNTAERRSRRRDKIYSALWHLVPPVPSFE